MFVDFVGQGGAVADRMDGVRYEPGFLRPFLDSQGNRRVTINTGRKDANGKYIHKSILMNQALRQGLPLPNGFDGSMVVNASTLRKDEWQHLDTVVLKAARDRLRAWSDLAAANTYSIPNGMGKTILEHETMSDPGYAMQDMDGLTDGRNDQPQFQLEGIPLPITHADFSVGARQLATSRNTGMPIDTTMAEAAGRRVAELIEQQTIGVATGMAYGVSTRYGRTSQIQGYTNFAERITKTNVATPTGSNGNQTILDILAMIQLAADQKFYGPFMLYHSTSWDYWLDNDYVVTAGNNPNTTLRNRIKQIPVIQDVRRLDYLTSGYQLVLVQMTPDVARAVIGMPITTVQWETMGGLKMNFKVMTISVPQLRADYNGNCGIVHGTTS